MNTIRARQCDCWITGFGFCLNAARFRVRFKVPPHSPHSDVYYMCAPCYDLAMESGKYVDIDLELTGLKKRQVIAGLAVWKTDLVL